MARAASAAWLRKLPANGGSGHRVAGRDHELRSDHRGHETADKDAGDRLLAFRSCRIVGRREA